ncbi:MAG: TerC family protein [Bacteroidia bacterium]
MHDYAQDLHGLLSINGVITLLTLSVLEVVLGIDNIIFISIIADRLPRESQPKARTTGLILALVVRCLLLFSISWITRMVDPLFHIGPYGVSGRGLILFGGGLFLLYKTWKEIQEKIHGSENEMSSKGKNTMNAVIFQIVLIDIVFSFDSILTAVAISNNIIIMVSAVIVSMILMMLFSGAVADFINRNQGIKMIALGFLLVIGGVLLGEAVVDSYNSTIPNPEEHVEINKNYAYVAFAFALMIEFFNMKERRIRREKDFKQEK